MFVVEAEPVSQEHGDTNSWFNSHSHKLESDVCSSSRHEQQWFSIYTAFTTECGHK